MSLNLSKGHKLNLTKHSKSLKKINFCLGWECKSTAYDLDASALALFADFNGQPKVIGEEWVIYYNQKQSPKNLNGNIAITHSGDDRVGGDGKGANEIIMVDITNLPLKAQEVAFIVTIDEGRERKQSLGQVKCFIQLIDTVDNEELARYDLNEMFTSETSVHVGSLYKEGEDWCFKAVGIGSTKELRDYCLLYGASVE